MEELTLLLLGWGVVGLVVASFTESFCSPLLPDFILIPLALAVPEKAIYYGAIATGASVLGGVVGYWIGHKVGPPAARRMIPEKYLSVIQKHARENATWAIVVAALSPIPYKFLCITAGALKVDRKVFLGASLLGRGKRFMVEGVLIYYFGAQAIAMFDRIMSEFGLVSAGVLILAVIGVAFVWFRRRSAAEEPLIDGVACQNNIAPSPEGE